MTSHFIAKSDHHRSQWLMLDPVIKTDAKRLLRGSLVRFNMIGFNFQFLLTCEVKVAGSQLCCDRKSALLWLLQTGLL